MSLVEKYKKSEEKRRENVKEKGKIKGMLRLKGQKT
jgi:hypothetical protein